MPTIHADPILQAAREQLSYCREELVLGARRLRVTTAPDLADVHLMCDAILEYLASHAKYEQLALAERVTALEVQARLALLGGQ